MYITTPLEHGKKFGLLGLSTLSRTWSTQQKQQNISQRVCLYLDQNLSTQHYSGISKKTIRSISAGARWPMQTPSTANHKVARRSRGSPPLLQLLHRRVRLPSVFDQNHGVARHLGHERGIKPSTATSLVVIVAINQPCLTIVQSRAFR